MHTHTHFLLIPFCCPILVVVDILEIEHIILTSVTLGSLGLFSGNKLMFFLNEELDVKLNLFSFSSTGHEILNSYQSTCNCSMLGTVCGVNLSTFPQQVFPHLEKMCTLLITYIFPLSSLL